MKRKGKFFKDNVLTEEPSVDSRASLILLKRELRALDPHVPEYEKWLAFRLDVLKEREENGELNCFYCGCGPLLADVDQQDPRCATLDHVNPLASGGPKYDRNNLLVACKDCNSRKRDMSVQSFLELLGLELDKEVPLW
jgi:5-methylcytosine-specific restriction endonuclease McrA